MLQKHFEDSKLYLVHYMSKKTSAVERKYTSYELEALVVVAAVRKFHVLLGKAFKIITDCAALQQTMRKKEFTSRVAK